MSMTLTARLVPVAPSDTLSSAPEIPVTVLPQWLCKQCRNCRIDLRQGTQVTLNFKTTIGSSITNAMISLAFVDAG